MGRKLVGFTAAIWCVAAAITLGLSNVEGLGLSNVEGLGLSNVEGLGLSDLEGLGQGTGWQLPASAADEKNPVDVNAATLAAGRRLFRDNCQRCHGPQGKGNGSDADPKFKRTMDLTSADRADRNPDGVVFHKIWSGREKPKMPALKDKLTKEQVWTLVAYVQSLRAKS